MGRIKTTAIKNMARDLIAKYGEKFTTDFEENKKAIEELKLIKSKKIRNILAGYLAKEMQRIKSSGI